MNKYRVLYDIKSFETLIVRTFINDSVSQCEETKNFPTPTQMRIIEYIVDAKDDVYQKDLENILNLRRATVSGVLQTMEKNGLIERVSSDIDARVKKVILNPKTKNMFLEQKHKLEKLEELVIRNISELDLETFSRVLETMKKNIHNYLDNQNIMGSLKKGDK